MNFLIAIIRIIKGECKLKIKDKWHDWRQYRNNIKYYKKFLKSDVFYDNASVYLFLELKLQRTATHYRSDSFEPYDNSDADLELVERAWYLAGLLHKVLEEQLPSTIPAFHSNNDELFDILKNCHKWWD